MRWSMGTFFKTVLLGGLLSLVAPSVNAQAKTGSLPKTKKPKVGYFQVLYYEHNLNQRASIQNLHQKTPTIMQDKADSSDESGDVDGEGNFYQDMGSTLQANPGMLPIIYFSAHGTAKKYPIRARNPELEEKRANVPPIFWVWNDKDGSAHKKFAQHEFVDTLIKSHEYQLRPATIIENEGTPQEHTVRYRQNLLSVNYFNNVGRIVNGMACGMIAPMCEGTAGIENASALPGGSQTLFSSSGKEVTWDYRSSIVEAVGQDPLIQFSSITNVITGFIKHSNGYSLDSNYANFERVAVTMETMADPKAAIIGMDHSREVRVIDMKEEMPTLIERYGEEEILATMKEMESQFDPARLKTAFKRLKEIDSTKKSVKSVFFKENKSTVNRLNCFGEAQAITYRVCLKHLNDMPAAKEYMAKVNFIPDADRLLTPEELAEKEAKRTLTPYENGLRYK